MLAGCSTGIVQMDKDTYMVGRFSSWPHWVTENTAIWQKANAYEEAGKFCAFSNKKIETLNLKDIEARSWFLSVRTAKVELDFRCIN